MIAFYRSRTTHARFVPKPMRFSQRLFSILIDIDAAPPRLRLFSFERFNLYSFHRRDHGDGALRPWAEAAFARAGVALDGGAIRLLCMPRVLGFVFNPISLWFGYGPEGALRGVLYDVRNTFGERHIYAAALDGDADAHTHLATKRFYVSPFQDIAGAYHFRVHAPGETFALRIDNIVDGACVHAATLAARRIALTDAGLLRAFAALPFMTLQVVIAIHARAFAIWLAGARYRSRQSCASPPAISVATS